MSQENVVSDVEATDAIPEVQATKQMLVPSVECVSIYSYKETWFIVGIIALAGFARYAYFGFLHVNDPSSAFQTVHFQPRYISLRFLG